MNQHTPLIANGNGGYGQLNGALRTKAACRAQTRAAECREMAVTTRDPLTRRQMCVSAASALIHSRFERGVATPVGHPLSKMIVAKASRVLGDVMRGAA